MKTNSTFRIFIVLLASFTLGLTACDETIEYSPIPDITFMKSTVTDSTDILGNKKIFVELLFSVIDGDGDMGLSENDTTEPFVDMYQYNFFSTVFYFDEGVLNPSEIEDYNYRIPYVEVENHKAYKAEITVEFEYYESQLTGDSIAYEFFIVDRSLNHSDTIRTPGIPVQAEGI